MGRLVYRDIETQAERHLALTSLTAEEFALLLPSFERAFQGHMQQWCLDGTPRTGRSYTTYKNCPLPSAQERLLFLLVYLKTNPLQEAHAAMFGMPQGKANMWIHTLLPVLQATFRTLGDAPSRNLDELAKRLTPAPPQTSAARAQASPLFATTARNDESRAPKMLMNRSAVSAARKSATRSRTCS